MRKRQENPQRSDISVIQLQFWDSLLGTKLENSFLSLVTFGRLLRALRHMAAVNYRDILSKSGLYAHSPIKTQWLGDMVINAWRIQFVFCLRYNIIIQVNGIESYCPYQTLKTVACNEHNGGKECQYGLLLPSIRYFQKSTHAVNKKMFFMEASLWLASPWHCP